MKRIDGSLRFRTGSTPTLRVTAALAVMISALCSHPVSASAASASPIRVQTKTSGALKIVHTKAVQDGSHLRLTGAVERRMGYSQSPVPSHLDITVLSADQKVLETLSTSYSPYPVANPSSRSATPRSHFGVELKTSPSEAATIVITEHRAALSEHASQP